MSELQQNFVSRLSPSDWWFFVEHYNVDLKRWDIQSCVCLLFGFFLASSQSSRTSQWDEFNHPEKSREASPPQVDQFPPDLDTDQNWPGGEWSTQKLKSSITKESFDRKAVSPRKWTLSQMGKVSPGQFQAKCLKRQSNLIWDLCAKTSCAVRAPD